MGYFSNLFFQFLNFALCFVLSQPRGKEIPHEENSVAKSLVRSGREATASGIGSKKIRKNKKGQFLEHRPVAMLLGNRRKLPLDILPQNTLEQNFFLFKTN